MPHRIPAPDLRLKSIFFERAYIEVRAKMRYLVHVQDGDTDAIYIIYTYI